MSHVWRVPKARLVVLAVLTLAGVALFLVLSRDTPLLAAPDAVQEAP
jgi:hypothetical protein